MFPVWDTTWMSAQSVHLAKRIPALGQVTGSHLVKCSHFLFSWTALGQVAYIGTQPSDIPGWFQLLNQRLGKIFVWNKIQLRGGGIPNQVLPQFPAMLNGQKFHFCFYLQLKCRCSRPLAGGGYNSNIKGLTVTHMKNPIFFLNQTLINIYWNPIQGSDGPWHI